MTEISGEHFPDKFAALYRLLPKEFNGFNSIFDFINMFFCSWLNLFLLKTVLVF